MGQRGLPEEVITEEVPRGGRAAAGLADLPREAALSRGQAFGKAGGRVCGRTDSRPCGQTGMSRRRGNG